MFDIRDASVAGCCTLAEGTDFPLLLEQHVLHSKGKTLELLSTLDGHRGWMLQAKKMQDSERSPR